MLTYFFFMNFCAYLQGIVALVGLANFCTALTLIFCYYIQVSLSILFFLGCLLGIHLVIQLLGFGDKINFLSSSLALVGATSFDQDFSLCVLIMHLQFYMYLVFGPSSFSFSDFKNRWSLLHVLPANLVGLWPSAQLFP